MANISDSAGIFTGRTLDLFNAAETVVARDGDVAYAQLILSDALTKLLSTTQLGHSVKPGAAVTARKP